MKSNSFEVSNLLRVKRLLKNGLNNFIKKDFNRKIAHYFIDEFHQEANKNSFNQKENLASIRSYCPDNKVE